MRLRNELFIGDALDVLKTLPSNCVQCCVTSPPYWGLRDYGTRRWFGGELACEHDRSVEHGPHHPGAVRQSKPTKPGVEAGRLATTASCSKCEAWWGQLGLEPTPELYVRNMVEVFREVRRVLRADGTFWLNVGDCYANDGKWGGSTGGKHAAGLHGDTSVGRTKRVTGLKPKDLIGIPWMLAFALRADGWWLRSDIIWHKPNPMPESVEDRPTRSHEFVFLLTKSAHYFYDVAAIREPFVTPGGRDGSKRPRERNRGGRTDGLTKPNGIDPSANGGANKRDVWRINAQPYKGEHSAVMPPALPDICIRAGTSEKGACPACGSPWRRQVERARAPKSTSETKYESGSASGEISKSRQGWRALGLEHAPSPITVGCAPTCKCDPAAPTPCLVLDPFAGSGTTLMVAKKLNRDFLGIEINEDYLQQILARVGAVSRPVDVDALLLDLGTNDDGQLFFDPARSVAALIDLDQIVAEIMQAA